MSDQKPLPPKPQYGEYASEAELQALKARQGASEELLKKPKVDAAPRPNIEPALVADDSADLKQKPRLGLDAFITLFLLSYGLILTLTNIPQFTDYYGLVKAIFEQAGASAEPVNLAAGQAWGMVAAFVMGLGWLATAVLCWFRFKANKSSWWIALLAGAIVNIVCMFLIAIPLLGEPDLFTVVLNNSP